MDLFFRMRQEEAELRLQEALRKEAMEKQRKLDIFLDPLRKGSQKEAMQLMKSG